MRRQGVEPEISISYIFSRRLTPERSRAHGMVQMFLLRLHLSLAEAEISADRAP